MAAGRPRPIRCALSLLIAISMTPPMPWEAFAQTRARPAAAKAPRPVGLAALNAPAGLPAPLSLGAPAPILPAAALLPEAASALAAAARPAPLAAASPAQAPASLDGRRPPSRAPGLAALRSLAKAGNPAWFWTGARPRASSEETLAAGESSPLPRLKAGRAGAGSPGGPVDPEPRIRIPKPGFGRRLADSFVYHRLLASSLWWYTFPRLFERWEEMRRSIEEAPKGPLAVRAFRRFFIAHRVLGSTGNYSPLGFRVAANGIVLRDSWYLYETFFRASEAARESFMRFLYRAGHYNPNRRSTQFRKIIFHALRQGATLPAAELPAFFDSLATKQAGRELRAFQKGPQRAILKTLDTVVRETILETNQELPPGRRIAGALLLGSFANGAAGPDSDLDIQAISEDGRAAHNQEFLSRLKARWKALGMTSPISTFQYVLPLSRELITRLHQENYLIFSPYPEVLEALRRPEAAEAPEPKRQKLGGWLFQSVYWVTLLCVLTGYDLLKGVGLVRRDYLTQPGTQRPR